MISLRKYLDLRDPRETEAVESHGPILSGLCSSLLDLIVVHVLSGEGNSIPRARLEQAKVGLCAEIGSKEAGALENAVRRALANYSAARKESDQRSTVETQHIVAVLNQALMVIGGGSKRSVSRLQHIQETLQRASVIRDPEGLRASLADAVTLIQEESAHEKEHGARDLEGFASEVAQIREHIAANPSPPLPGRKEAIQALADRLSSIKSGFSLYLVAFSLENATGIIHRYGKEPVDELCIQLIRERAQRISPAGTAWRWSPNCIVIATERAADLAHVEAELRELCRVPLAYHMNLGSRTALLKVGVSSLVAALTPVSMRSLIEQIDKFSGVQA